MTKQQLLASAGKFLRKSGDFLNTNSPVIFAGIAIAGVVTTAVVASRATLKAEEIIKEATYKDPDTGEEVHPDVKEIVCLTWACFIPVFLSAGLTIGAIVMSNRIQNKRNVLLAGLYSTSQKALEDYQKKTEEEIGKSKSEKIKNSLAADELAKHPIEKSTIHVTGHGESLCYDPLSGRYFYTNYEDVRKAINDFNEMLIAEDRLPLNDLYEFLGLDTCELGVHVGWTAGEGVKPVFRSRLASNGTPCLVIDHENPPTPSFRDW